MTAAYEWADDLPHMEVRKFIAYGLREGDSSPELDAKVCAFLGAPVAPVTSDVFAALGLIPVGWWWHISHLEAQVIPTVSVKGMEDMMSNGAAYDQAGRPVAYSALCFSRDRIPQAICTAMLKARYDLPDAFVVMASKKEEAAQFRKFRRKTKSITISKIA